MSIDPLVNLNFNNMMVVDTGSCRSNWSGDALFSDGINGTCLYNSVLTSDKTIINTLDPSADFAIEYWMYFPFNPSPVPSSKILCQPNSNSFVQISFDYSSPYNRSLAVMMIRIFYNSSNSIDGSTSTYLPVYPNAWHHYAHVRQSNVLKTYIDGVLSYQSNITNLTLYKNSSIPLTLNATGMYIDSFYIYSYAKYTGNFIPCAYSGLFEDNLLNFYGRTK